MRCVGFGKVKRLIKCTLIAIHAIGIANGVLAVYSIWHLNMVDFITYRNNKLPSCSAFVATVGIMVKHNHLNHLRLGVVQRMIENVTGAAQKQRNNQSPDQKIANLVTRTFFLIFTLTMWRNRKRETHAHDYKDIPKRKQHSIFVCITESLWDQHKEKLEQEKYPYYDAITNVDGAHPTNTDCK